MNSKLEILAAATYLNGRHNSIKFTTEFEQAEQIPFLDILVKRCPNNTFVTSVYRKKTLTGLYTKWDSFTPRKYKINAFAAKWLPSGYHHF